MTTQSTLDDFTTTHENAFINLHWSLCGENSTYHATIGHNKQISFRGCNVCKRIKCLYCLEDDEWDNRLEHGECKEETNR